MFGSRSEYLAAPEDEVVEQRCVWLGKNEAAKIQKQRDEAHQKELERRLLGGK